MNYEFNVKVAYPLKSGRIVLRIDSNWAADVEATGVNALQNEHIFNLNSQTPFFYFKPCIVDGEQIFWSLGTNYLAVIDEPEKDIYPHFFTNLSGTISDKMTVSSTVFQSQRKFRVYFPPGYDENTLKKYAVIYMHDGNNLFFPQEAFLGDDWQVDKTMDLLDKMNAIDKVIVVGIYTEDRMSEYTSPGYRQYGEFIVKELKPLIDNSFRTLDDASNTAVMGSSLGGVVSLYLAWNWSNVFGKAACLSSTFGYRDDLFQRIAAEEKRNITVYLDSGWIADNYEDTRCMRDILIQNGFVFGSDLLYFAFPEAAHNESYWATRCHIPFQFFFSKLPIVVNSSEVSKGL